MLVFSNYFLLSKLVVRFYMNFLNVCSCLDFICTISLDAEEEDENE
jgi:hypothetical protein